MTMLALGNSRCSLCRETLQGGELILASTHFIADEADPLSRYSDTGMHVACFLNWEHRADFAAQYEAKLGRKLSDWVPAVSADQRDAPDTARSQ